MYKKNLFLLLLHMCIGVKMLQAQTTLSPDFSKRLLQYDVSFYKLDVKIGNTTSYIAGNGIISGTVSANRLDTFAFQLHQNHSIDSVNINGISYTNLLRFKGETEVKLDKSILKGEKINAQIFYRGQPPATVNNWKLGLINEIDPTYNVRITHSLSVPYSAFEWWPCKQVVTDVADSVFIYVTTDTSLQVASNGKLVRTVDLEDGRHRFEWQTRHPINYYLVSVAVAPYFRNEYPVNLPGIDAPVLLQDFIYNTPKGHTDAAIPEAVTPEIMRNYSALFGNYFFADEKYGVYTSPVSGGMEHQTMSAIGDITDKYLLAHELAHQWFGDNVNLVTYRDMWLNEGFASYAEYLTAEKIYPDDAAKMMQGYHNLVMTQTGGSVYVTDTVAFDNLYEGRLVYRKGAAILHTLRFLINNDEKFFGGIKSFQEKYSGKNVRALDFKTHMEAETGVNLDAFFQQWYYGEGYPTLNLTWNHKNDTLKIRTIQTTSTVKTRFFRTPYEIKVKRAEGDTILRLMQDTNTSYHYIALPGNISGIDIDPNNWILNKSKVTKDVNLSIPKGSRSTGYIFRIYPNPAHDKLYIDIPENALGSTEKLKIEITQIDGKVCLQQDFSSPQTVIDTTFLGPGIYFLSIIGDHVNFRQKVMKN